MEKDKKHYGLFTAITMIVGIVIGSGIFFKSDEVLKCTGGNVTLGVLAFCIGALSIIFGSLTLVELSSRSTTGGGIIGYYEDFISSKVACGFGWFQMLVYFPSFAAILGWVSGNYICALFSLPNTLEMQTLIGIIVVVIMFVLNIISLKFSSYFQNISTIIKLVPLIFIAVVGIFAGSANCPLPEGVTLISKSNVGLGWIAALTPVVFAYDGWIIATTISDEVKNPKKVMPLALTIGPIIVLAAYLLYFVGLNRLLGPEYIMSVGNQSVNNVGKLLLGSSGERVILVFVIIAALGVLNGVIMGSLRTPNILANKNMLPKSMASNKNSVSQFSLKSCILSILVTIFWLIVNYVFKKFGVLKNGSDVCSIAIVFSYTFYAILYIKVILMKKNKIIKSPIKGILFPILAMLGSLIILIGGIVSTPIATLIFIVFCILVFLAGTKYFNKTKQN